MNKITSEILGYGYGLLFSAAVVLCCLRGYINVCYLTLNRHYSKSSAGWAKTSAAATLYFCTASKQQHTTQTDNIYQTRARAEQRRAVLHAVHNNSYVVRKTITLGRALKNYSAAAYVSFYLTRSFYCQAQVPGQVQKVQGLRTKDLDLG